MENIFLIILQDLEKVGIGVCVFLMCYIANILLGSYKNVRIEGYEFDWHLIVNSIIKFIIIGFGITFVTTACTIIPIYSSYIGIEIEESTLNTINSTIVIGSFSTAAIKYLAEAISKIKNILGM